MVEAQDVPCGGDDDDDEYAWRDGWIPARTVASASLMPSNVRVAAGRRAVALAAGHIDPPVAKDASVKKTNKGVVVVVTAAWHVLCFCLLYTSPSPRDKRQSRMPSSA